MSDALRSASELLVKEGRPRAQRVILLMTDGITNADQYSNPDDATAFAKSNGIVVYTVGFGSDADTTLLENIAQSTGGQYYLAGTGAELVQAFGTVARTLLGVSAPAHYGSRAMILLALPLIIFMPQIEKGVTQAYSGLTTMLRRQPTVVKPRYQKWSVCTRCEKPVRPGATYCHSCGLRLSPMTTAYQRCQECGRPLRSGARFCTKCGTRAKPHLE
jgi:hypothetical protein